MLMIKGSDQQCMVVIHNGYTLKSFVDQVSIRYISLYLLYLLKQIFSIVQFCTIQKYQLGIRNTYM